MMPKSIIHWKFETSGSVCYHHNEHKLVLTSIQKLYPKSYIDAMFLPFGARVNKTSCGKKFTCSISRQKLPYWSTLGWNQSVKFDTWRFEEIVCRELQCQLVGQSLIDSCRLPSMVPIHAKMLSPSGNAEIPRTPHVWKDHTIHCIRKLGTLETRQ